MCLRGISPSTSRNGCNCSAGRFSKKILHAEERFKGGTQFLHIMGPHERQAWRQPYYQHPEDGARPEHRTVESWKELGSSRHHWSCPKSELLGSRWNTCLLQPLERCLCSCSQMHRKLRDKNWGHDMATPHCVPSTPFHLPSSSLRRQNKLVSTQNSLNFHFKQHYYTNRKDGDLF